MKKKLLTVLSVLFLIIYGIKCDGIKKVVKRTMYQSEPCLDAKLIENVNEIEVGKKYEALEKPWDRSDGFESKVYHGNGVQYQWAWMRSLVVKGLKRSATIDHVLNFIKKNDCLFVPVGKFVKDVVLRNQPDALVGEVSCDISTLHDHCKKKYGSRSCSLYPNEDKSMGEYRLEIGDSSVNISADEKRAEPIQVYEWRSMIGKSPAKWSFSVDALAIFDDDIGKTYLIDIFGQGYRDTCDKKLVATVGREEWDEWSQHQMSKILGFFELRDSGYSVATSDFHTFVNEKVKTIDKKEAQTFYCENILNGVISLSDETKAICYTVYPKREKTERIKSLREIMIKETGPIWNETIGTAIEEMEAVFCTNKKFVETRNLLKHRIQTDEIEPEVLPKQIKKGKPMIDDLAEIHKRPIFPMNEELVELPREYPSIPNAKPNEKLEFVENHQPHIGGYNDPVAYEESKQNLQEIGVILKSDEAESEAKAKDDETKIAENVKEAVPKFDKNDDRYEILDGEPDMSMNDAQLRDYDAIEINVSPIFVSSTTFIFYYFIFVVARLLN